MRPTIYLIGGPNGAGKTTHAAELLRLLGQPNFVNADLVAASLNPTSPNEAIVDAARIVLTRTDELIDSGESFVIESTLSGRVLAKQLARAKARRFLISSRFVWLRSAELCVQRVALRVRKGGHDVPTEAIRRRHRRTIRNFFDLYFPLFDDWSLYDNSDGDMAIIARGLQESFDAAAHQKILRSFR